MARVKHRKNRTHRVSRRTFLKKSAAMAATGALAPMILPSSAWGATAPSNRIHLGMVGMGKMMTGHVSNFLQRRETQIVGMCDVDSSRLAVMQFRANKAYSHIFNQPEYNSVAITKDFRELAAREDIDAVVIATPDHWHALIAIEMAKHGKDIYCEKPMTLTINEGKALIDAVRRHGRIFQTGSQQRSNERFYRACELVRNGRIGTIKKVHVNIGGPPVECYLPAQPVPEGLDWDMWLGPAPYRPFHKELAPIMQLPGPVETLDPGALDEAFGGWANFRAYRDYSGGGMTDWGAHHFDIAQWGLGMDESGPVEILPPNGADVQYLTYTYADGTIMQRRGDDTHPESGVTFYGDQGTIWVNRSYLAADPVDLLAEKMGPADERLYRSPGHHRNWLECIRSRSKPICDVAIGHRSATVCHIGNIAYWLNRPLQWDPENEAFVDDAGANRLMQRPMRAPWRLS